jgi:hypothetical protein
MSTFRDAIASTLWLGGDLDTEGVSVMAADTVLDMPEMQAIRKALLHASHNAARHAYPDGRPDLRLRRYMEHNCHLPESVIAWVLCR